MSSRLVSLKEMGDGELITSARLGDNDAYTELYLRHVDAARAAARAVSGSRSDAEDIAAEAFTKIYKTLQGGGGPELAFRPYLLTAVRNVFFDRVRRNREEPSPEMADQVNIVVLDAAESEDDRSLAVAAFATLPERWQLVLWHTEVEGRNASEVAQLLGLAPNAVAALAYRAREGLRQAFLQAHLQGQVGECEDNAGQLGAYVRDGLSARDRRKVDAHLEHCSSCTGLVAEIGAVNSALKAAIIPALLGVPASAYLSGLGGKGVVAWFGRAPKKHQAAALGVAAAVIVAASALALSLGFARTPQSAAAVTALDGSVGAGGAADATGGVGGSGEGGGSGDSGVDGSGANGGAAGAGDSTPTDSGLGRQSADSIAPVGSVQSDPPLLTVAPVLPSGQSPIPNPGSGSGGSGSGSASGSGAVTTLPRGVQPSVLPRPTTTIPTASSTATSTTAATTATTTTTTTTTTMMMMVIPWTRRNKHRREVFHEPTLPRWQHGK